jgi:outer membrane protein OmpA-like peptidoglycan-associated protein
MMNRAPVKNVNVTVKSGDQTIRTLNTGGKNDFNLMLDFGKIYYITLQSANSPVMYFEVKADNIPPDKQEYRMRYELDVQFVPKMDEDIDTTVYAKPFHRVIFDGRNRMVDDAAYNAAFAKGLLKKKVKPVATETVEVKENKEVVTEPVKEPEPKAEPQGTLTIIAGKVTVGKDARLTVNNRAISLIGAKGEVLKTTSTNRYGAFSFTGINPAAVTRIRMEAKDPGAAGMTFNLVNSKNKTITGCKPLLGVCEWTMSPQQMAETVDNNFTSNIGGKLVLSSAKKKEFFANKTVYLSNKMNTVIRETKTNILGTFVFEDIKPDHNYYVGVEKTDLAPGQRLDVLSKEDNFITSLDTTVAGKASMKIRSDYNNRFNALSIGDDEMKMDIKAQIYGDNVNHPIGKLKVILLNDNYEVIDSALTDNLGTFRFKYLPFLKRFYLSAENTDNILDVFKNILIYSNDQNLIKIMTHQKGKKFQYKPVNAEITSMRDVELDDPWLEFMDAPKPGVNEKRAGAGKTIIENILFENGQWSITSQAKEILDKVILVLFTNKSLKIEIGAHTDSKGSEVANLKLSEQRAKTVSDYITAAGIVKTRIIAKGYGETKLMNKCSDNTPCSDIEHAQNRRIEFRILGE